jgi:hypothetical protein
MREMPTIASGTYTSSAVNLLGAAGGYAGAIGEAVQNAPWVQNVFQSAQSPTVHKQEKRKMATRRLVQVFIADPNENIPLDASLLYTGEQKLTDATDQELFFEIDIKGLLEKHNEKRTKIIDKKVKDRTEYLEPAKIRDLKMVVVAIANF